eukprot:CAMPEP_0184670952 /NCGR_PEP_ID=MMETSP0308-20130426/84759_1 /TAXON_ID=38269 /ORGANISM="Gloeochaete witrockiana, Strain SAG 46.84" /LENGTH=40 /DNA_ID= /DNA_START= /DNA_END= /DNA_ORIENTATION=
MAKQVGAAKVRYALVYMYTESITRRGEENVLTENPLFGFS